MSRSGYSDDLEMWQMIRWRGAVTSASRGQRGQRLIRDLIAALDVMPVKELIADELVDECGDVCALGAVAVKRGLDVKGIDPEDYCAVSSTFDVANALAREIVAENDEGGRWDETPSERWRRMRTWASEQLRKESPDGEQA